MDTRLRNIAARDAALTKTGRVTRLAAAAATTGSLVLMAGMAHLIPTHLPHSSDGGSGTGTGTGTGSTGTGGTGTGSGGSNPNSGNGAPPPGGGSGPTQATSGGS